ncbi:pitrilysin family protein [Kamptonema sp. UHCC 0994]|uniref:M16 family metallopeptidase n=1 Tax=Kamptonema sp. UHCC 0994 TaxID=3031329 RepID=UPI0023B9DE25|nr:pitrilysin family protein [Kamptonema sp. UHCC 0994]MDF0553428.1 pitrilysin family protein [Kamptonema sp. UHCC 0994]
MTATVLKPSSLPPLNAPTVRRLPNGLTIVAEHLPVDAVNLSIWLNVGSAVESDDINGMAHFLEHMIFKGTPLLAAGEFERLIEERGAVTNAATSQDYTHYYITCAPQDFAELAPLQVDVLLNASIPDEAFERERLVVIEEIRRAEDNARRRTYQRSMETAFEVLPYKRPVLGPASVIEQLTPQQMRDFHSSRYQPQSMTAVAVGNLPVEELIEIVAGAFAEAMKPQESGEVQFKPETLNLKAESAFQETVRREYVDSSLQQARLMMMWRVPGLANLEETYALDVLATILGHGRTTRLVQDLREERGLVSSISVSNMTQRLQGVFYISAQLAEENLAEVEVAIAEHIRTIQTELVTEAEMARVRTQVANRFIFGNETPSDRANLYGYYQSIVGDLAPAINYPTCIQALNAADIQQAARKYLSPDACGVVVLRPAK